jgi:hypothetical protein
MIHLFVGIFVDNAKNLIPSPALTFETMKRYFTSTMKDALAHGLTSIHDAGAPPEQIRFFKECVHGIWHDALNSFFTTEWQMQACFPCDCMSWEK